MADMSIDGNTSEVSRIINAPRHKIYQAFLDPQAVAVWLVPDNMQAHVLTFEPRQGGRFRISLKYLNPEDSPGGKTSEDTDTYQGQFIELVPDERIVEDIEFESPDPGFAGVMRMSVSMTDVGSGTMVSLLFENIPAGIRPEDNEEGSRQSLRKLADLLE
jgi:uncharacterized protein YndB with AHSA1/START domain